MIIFILLCSALGFCVWVKKKPKNLPLPPGPPADPLIGHLRLVPPENQETVFYEWGKVYGDVMHLHFLGRSVIVLNSVQAAVDLLDKRGANYSDRAPFVIYELMGWLETVTFMPYGKRFQKHRNMLHHYFTPNECVGYQSIQVREARVLLQNLVSDNNKRDDFIRRFATAIIIRIAFGHQITSDDDPYVKITEDTGYAVSNAGSPGSTPVDFFPFLRYLPSWFPGTYYAGFARNNKFAIDALHNYPFEEVSRQMAEGKAESSFLSAQLEALEHSGPDNPVTVEDIKGAAGIIFCAGVDSSWATLSIFFLAMVLHPEHQVRAQKEIDAVIGSGRLPEFSDRASLPYVECILQETLRWNSAVPLGVPHRSMEDDVYKGMFIPKGSLIIANTRAMTLDKNVYSDPFTFNPARYLPEPEGKNEPHPSGPFGFGRRICPGRHLADNSLWIAIASVLATTSISKAVDENGVEITPDVAFTSGITAHPHPYQCTIQPRNKLASTLISNTWDT